MRKIRSKHPPENLWRCIFTLIRIRKIRLTILNPSNGHHHTWDKSIHQLFAGPLIFSNTQTWRNSQVGSSVMYVNTGSWEGSKAPGVIMFRPFLADGSLGVQESNREARLLSVYPNPANDRVWFTLPSDAESNNLSVWLFDYSGRLVLQSVLQSNSLDLSGCAPGIYLLRMQSGNDHYYSKILIQP
jgi:hypothetical protein